MLILVQKKNEHDQFYISQFIYFESFQIHKLAIIYHFECKNCVFCFKVFTNIVPMLVSYISNNDHV